MQIPISSPISLMKWRKWGYTSRFVSSHAKNIRFILTVVVSIISASLCWNILTRICIYYLLFFSNLQACGQYVVVKDLFIRIYRFWCVVCQRLFLALQETWLVLPWFIFWNDSIEILNQRLASFVSNYNSRHHTQLQDLIYTYIPACLGSLWSLSRWLGVPSQSCNSLPCGWLFSWLTIYNWFFQESFSRDLNAPKATFQ